MINNLSELKEFLLWAKQNKVKSVKLKEVEFEISDLAFITEEESSEKVDLETLMEQANPESEDDEALFWSSR